MHMPRFLLCKLCWVMHNGLKRHNALKLLWVRGLQSGIMRYAGGLSVKNMVEKVWKKTRQKTRQIFQPNLEHHRSVLFVVFLCLYLTIHIYVYYIYYIALIARLYRMVCASVCRCCLCYLRILVNTLTAFQQHN